jgi:hypothetical protein
VIHSPRAIRSEKGYPLLNGDDVKDCFFVRETENNIYEIHDNLDIDDFIRKIVPAESSSTDIFDFSVFLYGYYSEKHIGIRKAGIFYPLFLRTNRLYEQSIFYEGNSFVLSFLHYPTNENYWHFQLYTTDNTGRKIPRDTKKKREKNLAKFIVGEYVKEAICPKSEVVPFRRSYFDKRIRPVQYFLKSCMNWQKVKNLFYPNMGKSKLNSVK